MKFDVFGKKENLVIVMLAGSFCAGNCLEYLYSKLCDDFRILVPTYNGLYENSANFTTRENEAKLIADYIVADGIRTVAMVYGQSMGSEVGAELVKQLLNRGVNVQHAVFDGAPMIRLSKAYKAFMHFKFSTMIKLAKSKSVDEIMNMSLVKQLGGSKASALRPMLEDVAAVAPFISKQTVKNQAECCYAFDFPAMSEQMQKNMHFLYGSEEKAYKTCFKGVKKAYPRANYTVKDGHGHMTYSMEQTDDYVQLMRQIGMHDSSCMQ